MGGARIASSFLFSVCLIIMIRPLVLLLLIIVITYSLDCFDGNRSIVDNYNKCSNVQPACFGQYYSIEMPDRLYHYFDRFCTNQHECHMRRLVNDTCLQLDQLDIDVQHSFLTSIRNELNIDQMINIRSMLRYSLVCCCSTTSLCNRIDAQMIRSIFNLTTISDCATINYASPLLIVIIIYQSLAFTDCCCCICLFNSKFT
jgi:hypothetical protein